MLCRLEIPVEAAKFGRRMPRRCSHCMVELPNAFESRMQGNFRKWQICLADQIPSKMNSARARDLNRRHTEMLYEQAP